MDSDELAAFVVILINVRFDTSIWIGSGKALATILHWEPRKGQRILKSLASKGYVTMRHNPGKIGNYPIRVPKYRASNGTLYQRHLEHPVQRQMEHTLKEVSLNKKREERGNPAYVGTGPMANPKNVHPNDGLRPAEKEQFERLYPHLKRVQ